MDSHLVVLLLAVAEAVAATATTAPRYGFVGVGVMSSAIIRGTCTLPDVPASSIVLSPRGAARSAELASEFPDLVTVATSNQDVVDSCDIVFIGVLPKQAEEVLRGLRFDARHTVVSLVSTCAMPVLQEACAPATRIVRAIPLPSVARHNGVCIMTPPHPDVTALFDRLGTCVAVETETLMKKMMPVTALMGQFYAQQRATQQWLENQGVGAEIASKWTGAVFHSVSYDSADPHPQTFEGLIEEQTQGGLNEQVIRQMTEAGTYTALADALDACLARIEARPAPILKKRPYASIEDPS